MDEVIADQLDLFVCDGCAVQPVVQVGVDGFRQLTRFFITPVEGESLRIKRWYLAHHASALPRCFPVASPLAGSGKWPFGRGAFGCGRNSLTVSCPVISANFTSTRAESMIACATWLMAFARSISIGLSERFSASSVSNRCLRSSVMLFGM